MGSFTEQQIFRAARDRIGNKFETSVSETAIPDAAIRAEMRECVTECCRLWATVGGRKEVRFMTCSGPTIATPGAPTLTPSDSGGTLIAGPYQYRISATYGTGETLAGPEAVSAAVVNTNAGSVTVAWSPVLYATGYNIYGRTAGQEFLLKQVDGATLSWVDTGAALPAGGLPTSNSTGGASGYLQDYDIPTFVGSDVLEVLEVIRSGEYRSNGFLEPSQVDPTTGVPLFRAVFIEQSFQQDALEVIQGISRANHHDDYMWEEVCYNNTTYIRISPPPQYPEVVSVTYVSSGATITSLPDEARPALEHAACFGLINCVLNRVNSAPTGVEENARDRRYWLELVERQRDYYEGKYRAALARRPRRGI